MPDTFTPARRGDLAAIVTEHRDYAISTGSVTCAQVELYLVTNLTRERRVRRVRPVWSTDANLRLPLERIVGFRALHLIPAATIDVPGAINAAREHRWPTGGAFTAFRPFASLDELRAALRPHLLTATTNANA